MTTSVLWMLFESAAILLPLFWLAFGGLKVPGLRPRAKAEAGRGEYIAEVWLDYAGRRGTTLYRHRFRTREAARLTLWWAIPLLQAELPSHYLELTRSGIVRHRYTHALVSGIRPPEEAEAQGCIELFSPQLPGHPEATAEPEPVQFRSASENRLAPSADTQSKIK